MTSKKSSTSQTFHRFHPDFQSLTDPRVRHNNGGRGGQDTKLIHCSRFMPSVAPMNDIVLTAEQCVLSVIIKNLFTYNI